MKSVIRKSQGGLPLSGSQWATLRDFRLQISNLKSEICNLRFRAKLGLGVVVLKVLAYFLRREGFLPEVTTFFDGEPKDD